MGGAARPLHDPGNHRSVERGSNLQAARRGGLMKPAKPAGERENTAALTPSLGTRFRGTNYLYAKTGSGAAYIQGDASFCTADSAFKYRSTPNCAMKSNFRQEAVDLNKHFTTNITGRASTGRSCF